MDDLRERALAAYNQVWNAAEGIDASTVGAVRAKAMDAAIVIIRTAAFSDARKQAAALAYDYEQFKLSTAIEKMEPEG